MFTLVTVATLAIAIGANTAIFSVLDGVLLKPLPYPNPDELVGIWHTAPGVNIKDLNVAAYLYFTYREESRTFRDLGLWGERSATVTGQAEPQRVGVLRVTESVLPVLGAQPLLGRWFLPKDCEADSPPTVLLSYGYWQSRFGGDPATIGRDLIVDGTPRQIVGVMSRDFRFLDLKPSLILPERFDRAKVTLGGFNYQGVARLRPGATLADANADVARMLPLSLDRFPPPPGYSKKMFEEARIAPALRPFKRDLVGNIGDVLWVLMGTIGLVLMIACANVANLLLVRVEGRQQELAVRGALGAGFGRIAGELLLESVALGLAGGVFGLGLAYALLRLLVSLAPANLPRLDQLGIGAPALVFTLLAALLSGVLLGLIPVFKYAAPHLATGLRSGGRGVSASPRPASGAQRPRRRPGRAGPRAAGRLGPDDPKLPRAARRPARLRAAGGGGHAAPLDPGRAGEGRRGGRAHAASDPGEGRGDPGRRRDGPRQPHPARRRHLDGPDLREDHAYAEGQIPKLRRFKFIAPGFLRTLGTPLVSGRDLTWSDAYDRVPVVLVAENVARELWGSPGAALGKRVREGAKSAWREVVGVVADVHDDGLDQPAASTVYFPILMKGFSGDGLARSLSLAIRSPRAGSEDFVKQVQQAVWSVNASLPLDSLRTLQAIYERSMARTSFTMVMLALAGGMALLLGVVGIYGVTAYMVSQRTREMGIRMALGARGPQLTGMIVRDGVKLAALGAGLGLLAALGLSRAMSALLFGVGAADPRTYVLVALALLAAATAASYVPARRATKIDPAEALRAE
jgi:hypothetical protein